MYGVPLKQSVERSDPEKLVPSPIRECCHWIRHHGLKVEGIFRKPGSGRQVSQWIAKFNQDPFVVVPSTEPPENVTSLIVKFLMNLRCEDGSRGGKLWGNVNSEAVLFVKEMRVIRDGSRKDPESVPELVRQLIETLPVENQATLKEICSVLHEASLPQHSSKNLMDSYNLALCVTPEIQWCVQVMIEQFEPIFAEIPKYIPELDKNVARMWHGYLKVERHLQGMCKSDAVVKIQHWHMNTFPERYDDDDDDDEQM